MRVMLLVQSGSQNGQRIVLRPGQTARFGRLNWADYSFPDDLQMAGEHFSIEMGPRGGMLRHIGSQHKTFVNDAATEVHRLEAGDVIRAGQTKLLVVMDQSMPMGEATVATVIAPALAPTPPRNFIAECQTLELSDKAIDLAAGVTEEQELLARWKNAGEYYAAARWLAHSLAKRDAVAWGCLVVGRLELPLKPLDGSALQAAKEWHDKPSEETRRQAESAAIAAGYSGPCAMLAAAAFWSEGSLAPANLPEVAPSPLLTGKAVATSLLQCASFQPHPVSTRERWLQILQCVPNR